MVTRRIPQGVGVQRREAPADAALFTDDGEHVPRMLREYERLWRHAERALERRLEALTAAARRGA